VFEEGALKLGAEDIPKCIFVALIYNVCGGEGEWGVGADILMFIKISVIYPMYCVFTVTI